MLGWPVRPGRGRALVSPQAAPATGHLARDNGSEAVPVSETASVGRTSAPKASASQAGEARREERSLVDDGEEAQGSQAFF